MSSPLREDRDGAPLLRVRAAPGASRDAILGRYGDALRIAVRAAPEKGKANAAIARLLAACLGVRSAQIVLYSGETSRDKCFRLEGVTPAEARARLAGLGTDDSDGAGRR